jgi:Cupredoxin-like domain
MPVRSQRRSKLLFSFWHFLLEGKWYLLGGVLVSGLLVLGVWWLREKPAGYQLAPEANRIQVVQDDMPFQILIPAFLPAQFDRAGMQILADQKGPGSEPMVQLAYKTGSGATLFARQWVPVDPDKEILSQSTPVQTKWGKGWLLSQQNLTVLWVDVGPLRVSLYTEDLDTLSPQQLLQIADTLGPYTNQQVFTFTADRPAVQALKPPPPVQIPINSQGVQEVTLVVTPGGYSPLRFAVKKDVPVRLIFKQLGQVGCGNELIFPADPKNPTSLTLASDTDTKTLEFTPHQSGDFEFFCSHRMYRGVMTVQ